ncbi:hypothetical protein OI25_7268 [Paraburkholderia fungorum]|jgi:hypothetical protein|uniref:Uncharacterized protein n=1 Tax=Paraburkholderia fungorum TaxID=134537 RepID=A0AAP5QI73_9BURK|nr:hypothetical protein [Paraburkholderia fungorum]AJZ56979.1 hypothetical protein OI25_7268 [Paraburkholderia fungorum]MDT8842689.1 hypothetical protein [Paraburkholderia fungorum]PRZ49252.1 hypothetical protein BX589_126161 [Paraburkholderia fungorum]
MKPTGNSVLWTVIHGHTGETLLTSADDDAYDLWQDDHPDYRKVLGVNQVSAELRERYARRAAREVFVVKE